MALTGNVCAAAPEQSAAAQTSSVQDGLSVANLIKTFFISFFEGGDAPNVILARVTRIGHRLELDCQCRKRLVAAGYQGGNA